ncbi:hypothetical protein V6Z12_D13G028700 [Gossypium hirsutum]
MASIFRNTKLAIPKAFFSTQAVKQNPPFPSFKAAKYAIITEKDPEKLAEIFEQCSHLPTFLRHRPIYHLSIRKLARANRLDLVDRLLETQKLHSQDTPALKSEGFWIRLIMLYSNAGMVPQALQTLDDLSRNRIGDLESAKKVLDKMLSDGYVLPCSFAYYSLIRSMVNEGELDMALEMSKEIIKRKWVPPFEAMEGLVKGLVERSRSEEAKQVVEKMKKRLKGDALESWGKIEAALPV